MTEEPSKVKICICTDDETDIEDVIADEGGVDGDNEDGEGIDSV